MDAMEDSKERLKCKFGILSRPDGSVMFCEGENTVLAGFYGPVEAKTKNMLIDKANVEVHFRPKTGLPGVEDRFYESIIRNICEASLMASLYPRSTAQVVIQELHNSGELISCAINAACLAALDSAIEMKFMFAAVSCFLSVDDTLHAVSGSSEKNPKALFVFVFDSLESRIIASHTEGSFNLDQYKEALQLCRTQSDDIFKFFRTSLLEVKG